MVPVGTILINRSLRLTPFVTTFFTRTLGLYVRLTVGTGLGLGGNHSVGCGFGLVTTGLFVADPPLPFLAVMMIWLFCVNTSTQAELEQSAIASDGIAKARKRMVIIKRFMCRDDSCAIGPIPQPTALTVDTCDTLSS